MRWLLVLLLALMPMASLAAERIAPAALVAAAKKAIIGEIDYTRRDCHDERTVEEWLASVVGGSAKSIVWSGGACELVNKQNPIDAGSDWCAQAEIAPKAGGDKATIEIYFEAPKGGQPGAAFAFRSIVHTKDGWDYARETGAFAVEWRETYEPEKPAPAPDDCR